MNHDMAQFREKLVRLQQQVSSAISHIDAGHIVNDTPLKLDAGERTGFSVGDFTVLDRFQTFTKEPQ